MVEKWAIQFRHTFTLWKFIVFHFTKTYILMQQFHLTQSSQNFNWVDIAKAYDLPKVSVYMESQIVVDLLTDNCNQKFKHKKPQCCKMFLSIPCVNHIVIELSLNFISTNKSKIQITFKSEWPFISIVILHLWEPEIHFQSDNE